MPDRNDESLSSGCSTPGASAGRSDDAANDGNSHSRAAAVRYQQLFESSPLPLWVYDLETLRFLDVNEVACAKYGYSRDEFLSMTILDIRPAEDAQAVLQSVLDTPAKVFSSGVWRHKLKNGQLINVEVTSHEMEYMGRATRFVCPIDVTARLRSEALQRRQAAALRRAQEIAQLAYVVISPDGRIEGPSENLAALVSLAATNLPATVAEWIERLVHSDDRAALRATAAKALATGDRVEMEYRVVLPGGKLVYLAQVFEQVEQAELPQDRRWFSTLQDITEQKLAAANLQRQAHELEERVRQRTLELVLANRELAQATEQAQQASVAKSRFLSTASHELRTPLNAILGFAQLLGMNGSKPLTAAQQADYGRHIADAGGHLLGLINELLDLAAIEAGKTRMSIEPLNLRAELADCIALIGPIASSRGIVLSASVGVEFVALGDRTRLRQVLINLLSNAVKYSPDGSAVDVVCANAGNRVRLSIVDHGAGMTPEQVAALYQPFNRLGREVDNTEGSGIGLVVTKNLVELMGGSIGVDSAPDVGSTFWIEMLATSSENLCPLRTDAIAGF